jgi:hypothetical protein
MWKTLSTIAFATRGHLATECANFRVIAPSFASESFFLALTHKNPAFPLFRLCSSSSPSLSARAPVLVRNSSAFSRPQLLRHRTSSQQAPLSTNNMPPKKDTTGTDGTKLLTGFEDKVSLQSTTPHIRSVLICAQETKLLAAAFVSCIGPDKVSDNIQFDNETHASCIQQTHTHLNCS